MNKIILATDSFPYGNGEKSFVLPELKRLAQQYDVTIISHVDTEALKSKTAETLPKGVGCITLARPKLTMRDKIKAVFSYVKDCDGRREIREILGGKKNIGMRLYQSLSFYAQALCDQKKLERSGILPEDEQAVYYSYWYTYFCYSMIRLKRRYPNITILTRTHGCDLYHERIPGDRQPFKHQMETRLEAILFACDFALKYYREKISQNIVENKLYVCRLGTEKVSATREYQRQGRWHMVSCSHAIPLKRVPLIVDALALLEDAEIHWTHIGDGEQIGYLKEYANEKLGGKDNISCTFTGYLENDKVIQYYRENQVDCFITTSSTEGGCPVSAQEAMKFGIPMIGTAVGGVTEMIQDNGILLPADPTAEDVAAAVREMISYDEETIDAMRNAALRLWEKNYDIDINTQKVLRILKCAEYNV